MKAGTETDIIVSSEYEVTSQEIIAPPEYTFTGIAFNTSSNTVEWTEGLVSVSQEGVLTTENLSAGSANWSSGTLYIYYRIGDSTLSVTTDISTAMQINQIVLATYRGGTDLIVGNGAPVIDGNKILAGTVGANAYPPVHPE